MSRGRYTALLVIVGALVSVLIGVPVAHSETAPVVKVVFIHHSVGQNWLDDDQGGLARALQAHNFYVSDTNYGWGPDSIGDRTDIPDWLQWFTGTSSATYLSAVYGLSEANSPYARSLPDPGGENRVIMFKSCFPNSSLAGGPSDAPDPDPGLTVGHAKYVYTQLLAYFATRPDKLFIVVTAPPNSDASTAANARAFNNWLLGDWLSGYPLANVGVFDFYNVLTGPANHHRIVGGEVEHVYTPGMDTAYYSSSPGDDHPNAEGSRKATAEFVPMLEYFYTRWTAGPAPDPPGSSPPEQPGPSAPPEQPGPSAPPEQPGPSAPPEEQLGPSTPVPAPDPTYPAARASTRPQRVAGVVARVKGARLIVTWTATQADGYVVQIRADGRKWRGAGEVTDTRLVWRAARHTVRYRVRVAALGEAGRGPYSRVVRVRV